MQYGDAPAAGAGATAAGTGGALAYTGVDVLGWILLGVALIVFGFVLIRTVVYRRPLLRRSNGR